MTHLVTKGVLLSLDRNRRDVGRIKWGYVNKLNRNLKNKFIVLKS